MAPPLAPARRGDDVGIIFAEWCCRACELQHSSFDVDMAAMHGCRSMVHLERPRAVGVEQKETKDNEQEVPKVE